jgi:hypothetical protein
LRVCADFRQFLSSYYVVFSFGSHRPAVRRKKFHNWLARPSGLEAIELNTLECRFYDAALLVLPLCWVFVSWRRARSFAVLSALLILPFLIPGGTLLETLQSGGPVPSALGNHCLVEEVGHAASGLDALVPQRCIAVRNDLLPVYVQERTGNTI